MTYIRDQDPALSIKKLVIFKIRTYKSLRARPQCFGSQKTARSPTNSDCFKLSTRQCGVTEYGYFKNLV